MDSNVEQGFWNPALTSINPQDLSFSSNPAHHDQKLPGQLAYDYSTTGMDLPTFQANSSANRALSAEQQAVVNEELNVVHPGDGNGHDAFNLCICLVSQGQKFPQLLSGMQIRSRFASIDASDGANNGSFTISAATTISQIVEEEDLQQDVRQALKNATTTLATARDLPAMYIPVDSLSGYRPLASILEIMTSRASSFSLLSVPVAQLPQHGMINPPAAKTFILIVERPSHNHSKTQPPQPTSSSSYSLSSFTSAPLGTFVAQEHPTSSALSGSDSYIAASSGSDSYIAASSSGRTAISNVSPLTSSKVGFLSQGKTHSVHTESTSSESNVVAPTRYPYATADFEPYGGSMVENTDTYESILRDIMQEGVIPEPNLMNSSSLVDSSSWVNANSDQSTSALVQRFVAKTHPTSSGNCINVAASSNNPSVPVLQNEVSVSQNTTQPGKTGSRSSRTSKINQFSVRRKSTPQLTVSPSQRPMSKNRLRLPIRAKDISHACSILGIPKPYASKGSKSGPHGKLFTTLLQEWNLLRKLASSLGFVLDGVEGYLYIQTIEWEDGSKATFEFILRTLNWTPDDYNARTSLFNWAKDATATKTWDYRLPIPDPGVQQVVMAAHTTWQSGDVLASTSGSVEYTLRELTYLDVKDHQELIIQKLMDCP
ncbi:hypothetical protein EV360DRAFT_90134 [Lentinula raphanica]|nr:hypothetical protein EV360DRAFT_90134 [Lentinula raphanica]